MNTETESNPSTTTTASTSPETALNGEVRRTRRPRTSAESIRGHLEAFNRSGLSPIDYSLQSGVPVACLRQWIYRAHRMGSGAQTPGRSASTAGGPVLLPVRIGPGTQELRGESITLRLPGGLEILIPVGMDGRAAADLLRHLGVSCSA